MWISSAAIVFNHINLHLDKVKMIDQSSKPGMGFLNREVMCNVTKIKIDIEIIKFANLWDLLKSCERSSQAIFNVSLPKLLFWCKLLAKYYHSYALMTSYKSFKKGLDS